MNLNITAYIIYGIITLYSLFLTWYEARTLFRNCIVYMRDIFHGRDEIAAATSTLFRIGFYLMNLGFALWILQTYYNIESTQRVIEVLSSKIGGFCIYHGIMLFLNMYLFFRGKRVARQKAMKLQTQENPAN